MSHSSLLRGRLNALYFTSDSRWQGWLLKKTYLRAGSLSSISNFTDRSFHAQIMWFGISHGRKGIETDIHGKLFIYSLTYFFQDVFLSSLLKYIQVMIL